MISVIWLIIFPHVLGKDTYTVQVTVEPLKIHASAPPLIYVPYKTAVSINCSAYGNTREMTGNITKSNGEAVPFMTERIGNLFVVISYLRKVRENGTYLCSISNGRRQVTKRTDVKIFNRKP